MGPQKRILIVDDDREIVSVMNLRLHSAGYETVTAHNGDDALTAVLKNRPDAIVLDVRMPGRNGLDTLAVLQRQEETRTIPVVMLSASLPDKRAALESGARFFLSKPYNGQELKAALRSALESPLTTSVE